MTLNIHSLRQQAESRLQKAAYDPKKLVLIHTAIALGASLTVTALNFLFSKQIANTGGLSGLGTRSILTTMQTLLELAVVLLLPFWEIGLIRAVIGWAKGEQVGPSALPEGFRRFGAVLGQKCLLGGLLMIVAFLASQFGTMVFMFTPFSQPFVELMAPVLESSDPAAMLDEAYMTQLMGEMTPYFIIFGVLFAALSIPLFYRVRFADFSLMDGCRPLESLLISLRATKGNVRQLIKLDLSFWWFYLLQGLTVVLTYGDAILAGVGVTLPMSEDASFFLFYVLGIAGQLVLLWQYQAKVSATYAVAWQTLNPESDS